MRLPMLRFLTAIGLALLALATPWAGAADQLADEVAVPPLKARVTDLTATLSSDEAATLERDLAQFEAAHGSQIAILIVPTVKPESIEQFGIRVGEAWKIGRKGVDDGVIILVAKNDRKLRIEVGRGLEGALPDAIAKRIVAEVIGLRFKAGDFYGGLRDGVARVESVIGGEALPPPPSSGNARQGGSPDYGNWLVVGLVIATVLGGVLSRIMGRLGGSTTTAGIVGGLAWLVSSSALAALVAAVLVFFFALVSGGRGGGMGGMGGFGGGGWGGGSSGGGGFSGGGGDFGGGGASGSW